jgi:hypothetical protein
VVDSAATSAAAVQRMLPSSDGTPGVRGAVTWLATDGAARVARVGSTFFGETLHPEAIEIIDL